MKRVLCIAVFCLLVAAAASGQSVTVASPNGGEHWTLGVSKNITWTYSGLPDGTQMKLILFRDGTKVGDIANNVAIGHSGAGSYPWSAGAYIGGTAVSGPGYKIRIRAMGDSNLVDNSNQAFDLDAASEPPGQPPTPGGLKAKVGSATAWVAISIQEPKKTAVWTIDETHTIRWHAADRVKYPLSIFLVSADHKIPIVDIGKSVPTGSFRPMEKAWKVTDNLYDGQYCIRITSDDRAYEQHSQPFTIKASRTRTFKVAPSAVYNKVHWHNIVSGDIWPHDKFHGGVSSIPDPGGNIIKYGYQRWYDDADNHGVTLHRSFVAFNLGEVIAQLTQHKYTVKGAWIDWKKAANSPQACAPNMWCLDAALAVGDGSNMFGAVFDAFPKHLLTGNLQIQIQMAQQWLGDPAKNYGLVISAANEGQTAQNGQCVQFCDSVVMTIEVEEKLNN